MMTTPSSRTMKTAGSQIMASAGRSGHPGETGLPGDDADPHPGDERGEHDGDPAQPLAALPLSCHLHVDRHGGPFRVLVSALSIHRNYAEWW